MPCRDYPSYDNDPALQKRADKNARIACEALSILEEFFGGRRARYNPNTDLSKEALDWWRQHQEFDRRRLEAEKTERARITKRKAALSKLSTEERRLLNLGD